MNRNRFKIIDSAPVGDNIRVSLHLRVLLRKLESFRVTVGENKKLNRAAVISLLYVVPRYSICAVERAGLLYNFFCFNIPAG